MDADFMQWIAIFLTLAGVVISSSLSYLSLRAAKIQTGFETFMNYSDRYHDLLFSLLDQDSDVFQQGQSVDANIKYRFYRIFTLFSEIHELKELMKEVSPRLWGVWQSRIDFVMSKPTSKKAWKDSSSTGKYLYSNEFTKLINQIVNKDGENGNQSFKL